MPVVQKCYIKGKIKLGGVYFRMNLTPVLNFIFNVSQMFTIGQAGVIW